MLYRCPDDRVKRTTKDQTTEQHSCARARVQPGPSTTTAIDTHTLRVLPRPPGFSMAETAAVHSDGPSSEQGRGVELPVVSTGSSLASVIFGITSAGKVCAWCGRKPPTATVAIDKKTVSIGDLTGYGKCVGDQHSVERQRPKMSNIARSQQDKILPGMSNDSGQR